MFKKSQIITTCKVLTVMLLLLTFSSYVFAVNPQTGTDETNVMDNLALWKLRSAEKGKLWYPDAPLSTVNSISYAASQKNGQVFGEAPPPYAGGQTVGLDITASFKDAGFLAAVRQVINKPAGPILDTDVANIRSLFLGSQDITHVIYDLSGIEHFIALTSLYCSYQHLSSLDISKNTLLEYVDVRSNQLETLSVSNNTRLKLLDCGYNNLTTLNVSSNTLLENLSCHDNQLTALNVLNNTKLKWIDCALNSLTALNVSNNTLLETLICNNNQLASLNVSNNTGLKSIGCSWNLLTGLDVSKNTALTGLSCSGNQLNSLDISKNLGLMYLYCSSNQLSALDVSLNTQLIDLICRINPLKTLNVLNNLYLDYLDCDSTQLSNLDVAKNTKLRILDCRNNQLAAVDVSKNIALEYFVCSNNQLATLDVAVNVNLITFECYANQLKTLDISKNIYLEQLDCQKNRIRALDISKNTRLLELDCQDNRLTGLNVPNNIKLKHLDCSYNYIALPADVIGWQAIPELVLDDTFIFYPQKIEPGTVAYIGYILYQTSQTPATVALFYSSGDPAAEATTGEDGFYVLNIPTPQEGGHFMLKVTKPGYLSYTINNLSQAGLAAIDELDIRPLAGDVNGDGIVNAVDLAQLLSEFNRTPLVFFEADIDGNGVVNATDLTYLLAGFNKRNIVIIHI